MAFVMAAVVSASSYAATKKKQETFSADSQMEYCVGKVRTALSQLRDGEGKYDYTMMPRNILDGKTWNCRKAKPEEWCSGFWPGVLWMAYKASGDGEIRQAAEGYTKALDFVATRQAYDHDLGFITINSWLKGIEALGDKAPQHYRRTREMAIKMLTQLSTDRYLSGDKNSAFLQHSTGHHPAGSEIDASIIYADYYYIEGIEKLKD